MRKVAETLGGRTRLMRYVPFDPAKMTRRRTSDAFPTAFLGLVRRAGTSRIRVIERS